jgi:hypothetical protein
MEFSQESRRAHGMRERESLPYASGIFRCRDPTCVIGYGPRRKLSKCCTTTYQLPLSSL